MCKFYSFYMACTVPPGTGSSWLARPFSAGGALCRAGPPFYRHSLLFWKQGCFQHFLKLCHRLEDKRLLYRLVHFIQIGGILLRISTSAMPSR